MKKVQIPYDLFVKLLMYHLAEEYDYADEIEKELQKKLDAMVKHEHYTKSKTAETEAERQAARIKYLDAVGMHEDFRY